MIKCNNTHFSNEYADTTLHHAVFGSLDFVNALLAAGCDPLHRDNQGRTPLQSLYQGTRFWLGSKRFNNITALVAAGDRSWRCVPTPCPGLEAAMVSVWHMLLMPEVVKRLENPPHNLIELFPRMDDDDEMKKVVQEVLRGLHHHVFGFPRLKE